MPVNKTTKATQAEGELPYLTFLYGPAGVRMVGPEGELCHIVQANAQIRHPQWPEGIHSRLVDMSVYLHRPKLEATAKLVDARYNVRVYPDGTFGLVPHELPPGEAVFITELLVVYGITPLKRVKAGILHPETPYVFGGTDTVPTTTGVGFGSEPRAPGGTTGWG